jgi:hypothetical protein
MNTGRVMVLMFAHRAEPTAEEVISLRQCVRVLGRHPMRLICPEGMDHGEYRRLAPGLEVDPIPARWLSSLAAYNRLKVMPWLYRRYAGYEYLLTHELDAYVFTDQLDEWCQAGWDYIGGPWFEGYYASGPDSAPAGAGNSGFSLRRVSSVLRVLGTFRFIHPPRNVVADWWVGRTGFGRMLKALTVGNNFCGPLNDFDRIEDVFWADVVPRRFPWFRVAPHEVARRFSFEAQPRRLFAETGGQLPFGCHKWAVLDREFWAAHIR